MRILVVEDDPQVCRTVRLALRDANYDVEAAENGNRALSMISTGSYDLVVLDLVLPGRSGLEVLRMLRTNGNDVPVLILTARDAMQDRVAGLDAGADDYLTKPFGLEELQARIRAIMRRRGSSVETRLGLADLEVDAVRRKVTRSGRKIALTNREFDLLDYLLRHQGEVVSRAALAQEVWGYHFDPTSNFVDVHIAHLRSKIDTDFSPKLLHTIRRRGYSLRDPRQPK